MSDADFVVEDLHAPAPSPPSPRHILAVASGNALEFYDFLTYAFFSAQIGRTFFPSTHEGASLLASLATFGAGFLMRPVGALVLGRVADKVGRKPAMLISFMMMGLGMIVLALTPSAHAIGIAAPIIVLLCRLTQGFALGGEVGPSTAYMIEAAPKHRRGLYVSFQYMGQDTAVLVAGLIGFALSSLMAPADLDSWGWRAAFLIGAVIVPFGLLLRRGLPETLHHKEDTTIEPARDIGRTVRLVAILGFVMLASGTTVSYVLNYLNVYASETLHMPTNVGFIATIVVGLLGVILDPLGGWLSDRFGRRPVMIAPWILLALVTVPAFMLLDHLRSVMGIIIATAAMTGLQAIASCSTLVAVTESMPKAVRGGGLGLIYAFAISIFGGSTQFSVAWLTGLTHSHLAPAWYMTAGVVAGVIAMLFLPETAPRFAGRAKG